MTSANELTKNRCTLWATEPKQKKNNSKKTKTKNKKKQKIRQMEASSTPDKSLERLLNEGKRYADKAKCRQTSVHRNHHCC